ncbi:MAG: DJ-1/PfpI family protein [Thiobacillaceae bacterium]
MNMHRRELFKYTFVAATAAALPQRALAATSPMPVPDARQTAPLTVPASGEIKVAFLISPGAEVVDFAGPWGVFEYVSIPDGEQMRQPFKLYTVAASTAPVKVSGGMTIVPDYSFADTPAPDVIVIPAMDTEKLAPAALDWLRARQGKVGLTMSVCDGAYVLAMAGLLDGKRATAHHGGYGMFAAMYPKVEVIRGVRYVEDGKLASSGGLTSGMDLALRVVERYFGRDVARQTARNLEYQSTGWINPASNAEFLKKPVARAGFAIDPVCGAEMSKKTSLNWDYQGKTYYFCGDWCKRHFMASPKRFLKGM